MKTHPHYQVSDTGLVRKVDGTLLKQHLKWKEGYPRVRFSNPRCMKNVHRLVAEAFVSNPHNKRCVNHLDFNPSNNNYKNLQWCSQSENIKYSKSNGRYADNYWVGRRSPNAYLKDSQISAIRRLYKSGNWSWERLGRKFNTSKRSIGRIVRNETYLPPTKQETEKPQIGKITSKISVHNGDCSKMYGGDCDCDFKNSETNFNIGNKS